MYPELRGLFTRRGGRVERGEALADTDEPLLELPQLLGRRVLQLGAELPLAQPKQQLLGRLLVDPLRLCTRVELGEQRDGLCRKRLVMRSE